MDWDPGFSAAPKTGVESKAIAMTWTANVPGTCANPSGGAGFGGTVTVKLVRKEGTTAPTTPTDGDDLGSYAPSSTQHDDFVQRSNKEYAYTIFACEDTGCSSWYGDGSGGDESTTNTSSATATEIEYWKLVGLTGETDVGSRIVEDTSAGQPNAPHALFLPGDWPDNAGKLILYFSEAGNATGPVESEVWYMLHDYAGWPSGGFNDSTDWDMPTEVAVGSTSTADGDYLADHPWAMLTNDGTNDRIQLFLQSQDSSDHRRIIQIESVDAVGNDFGLTCTGTGCADTPLTAGGYVAIEANGSSTTSYAEDQQHSRVAWDNVQKAVIDATTDEPFMMTQLRRPSGGTCVDPTPDHDDIGRADGAWNSTTQEWEWTVVEDGSGCAEIYIDDVHDNAMIPLPNDEHRIYYKDYVTDHVMVAYWNGTEYEDETEIEIHWGGQTTGPDQKCIENVQALVQVIGGTVHEGMFMRIQDSEAEGCDGLGLDNDDVTGSPDETDGGIVFAELYN